MKLGAQLYTLRKQMQTEQEIEKGLEKVADIGYSCVQVSGIGKIAPEKIKAICDRLGLEIAVTHIPSDAIIGNTEQVIRNHEIMDCKYIGLGAAPRNYRTRESVADFHDNFKTAVEKIYDSGKIFTYHNHQFEFQKFDGEFMLDTILNAFPKEQFMVTLDCYWANYGGVDVCDLIDRLAGRIDCVHLKDYAIVGSDIRMAPVMRGSMDYPKIIEHLYKAGTKYALVEQDDCYGEDPFDCLAESYNNLKKYF